MYDVCAQPGDCTTNAHAQAKTTRAPCSLRRETGATSGEPDLSSTCIGATG